MLFNRNNMGRQQWGGCGCSQPIIEPVINKCIEKEFCHEVQQY